MWDAVLRSGVIVNQPPPGMLASMATIASRRITLEGAMWRAARHGRLTHVVAHADRLLAHGGCVVGVQAQGSRYDVDRVLVATGRTSRFGDELRPPGEGGPCGQSYVSRTYRAGRPDEVGVARAGLR